MNTNDEQANEGRTSLRRRWTRRGVAITATGATFVLGGGIAFAAWSVSGSGTGAAAAGTASPLTIAGTTVTGTLVPGGTADVKLLLTNNNKANVSVSALTLSNTGIAGYSDNALTTAKTGCTTTGVTWTAGAGSHTLTVSSVATPIVIAANGGTYTLTLTSAASMSTASDDGCQSAFFNMPISGVSAVVTSSAAGATNDSGTRS